MQKNLNIQKIFLFALFLSTCVGQSQETHKEGSNFSRTTNTCPFSTPKQWDTFFNEKVREGLGDRGGTFYARAIWEIADILENCESEIKTKSWLRECTKNLRTVIAAPRVTSDNDLAMEQSDKDYFANQDKVFDDKALMKLPNIFNSTSLGKIKEEAKKRDWPWVSFPSRLTGQYRTLFFVPDPRGRFDQWVQFDHNQNDELLTPSLNLITIQKKNKKLEELEKPRIHFREYSQGKELMTHTSLGGCVQCHSGGLLSINETFLRNGYPLPDLAGANVVSGEAEAKRGQNRLKEFNVKMLSYGEIDFHGTFFVEKYGPKLGEKQGCTGCHDVGGRGMLTPHFNMDSLLQSKVVEHLEMPPRPESADLIRRGLSGLALTEDEKKKFQEIKAQNERLYAEIRKGIKDEMWKWLVHVRCETANPIEAK